ncbi:MAG: glycoside hydrolase family 16 protein [Burkholderiaceae bacterium]|nr:glycoside hydrolase family 16 protein [Burkholderiaceae bacterium]
MKKILCALALYLWLVPAWAADLQWAGTAWSIRSGAGKPCATHYANPKGAWVDAQGWLHLKLVRGADGQFACVELESRQRFGYGHYAFEVRGPIGAIDPNVVLGIFMYPTPDVGKDRTNEIDIEIARWGKPGAPQIYYTVWGREHPGARYVKFAVPENIDHSIFAFDWQPNAVTWQSPLQQGSAAGFEGDIADQPQKLHFNLWLFKQPNPANGREVEFTIKSLEPLSWMR